MQNTLAECMRVGGEAINLESVDRNYEAYRKYLFVCLKAFGALSAEVNDMKQENHAIRLKLAKMANQCAERILTYCETPDFKCTHLSPSTSKALVQDSHSAQRPHSPIAPSQTVVSATRPTISARRATVGASANAEDPEVLARRHNQLMLELHRKRMETGNYNSARMANLTLSLQKKMIDNMVMAKKKKTLLDHQLLERQKMLKDVADQRISALNLSDPVKEKQHNELLTTIFLHDDNHRTLSSLKNRLSKDGVFDGQNANELCFSILRSDVHPLAVLMKDCQTRVKEVTEPLCSKYKGLVLESLRVPFTMPETEPTETVEPVSFNVSEDVGQRNELNVSEEGQRNELNVSEDVEQQNETFESNYNIAADQVKAAIYKTDKEIGKLLNDKPSANTKPLSKQTKEISDPGSQAAAEKDEMDSLFDSDEECDANDYESSTSNSTNEERVEKPDNRLVASASETNMQALMGLERSSEFSKQLKDVTRLLHEVMHSLRTLLLLAYDGLNCTEGSDVVATVVQECLFADIGEPLQFLYRLANMEKEKVMAVVMTRYRDQDISCMQVKEKWYLGTHGECYLHLSQGLKDLISTWSPLEKMSCAVKVNKGVIETTSDFYRASEVESIMGADDLLPIICYVVLKSEMPQIVSQCAMMEEFIPSEYMMEEEGYALSTVIMAMQYLLTL